MEKLPLLKNIKKWIYRENYKFPKPNSECYELAKKMYYNGEEYIIGIEDSLVGFNSIKQITDIIYIYDNINLFKNNDCYLFHDFHELYYNV
jgi:hypothetical protein